MATRLKESEEAGGLADRSFDFDIEERGGSGPKRKIRESAGDGHVVHAVMIGPDCAHEWGAVPDEQQTLTGEGKTIFKCRMCGDITHTYSWQVPK